MFEQIWNIQQGFFRGTLKIVGCWSLNIPQYKYVMLGILEFDGILSLVALNIQIFSDQ